MLLETISEGLRTVQNYKIVTSTEFGLHYHICLPKTRRYNFFFLISNNERYYRYSEEILVRDIIRQVPNDVALHPNLRAHGLHS